MFSLLKRKHDLNAYEFLEFVVSMLQSNREVLNSGTLLLIATLSKPPRLGVLRKIKSIPYSLIADPDVSLPV